MFSSTQQMIIRDCLSGANLNSEMKNVFGLLAGSCGSSFSDGLGANRLQLLLVSAQTKFCINKVDIC